MPAAIDQAMDPQISEIVSLQGIRKRANKVLEAARAQELTNFTFDESLMSQVEDLVTGIIMVKTAPRTQRHSIKALTFLLARVCS
jgi:hypothetical protein